MTSVLFVIVASSVVLSTFLPLASFSSIPNSSINAPLVPEPSSLDTTVIVWLFDEEPALPVYEAFDAEPELPHATIVPMHITLIATAANLFQFFILMFFSSFFIKKIMFWKDFSFLSTLLSYLNRCKIHYHVFLKSM